MSNSYRAVLAEPGATGFVAAGLLARLPMSMLGIGIVFAVRGTGGSYGSAGLVAAVYGLVQAVCSPQLARLIDRFGQARVMRPAIAVHVAGLILLVVCCTVDAPLPALLIAAVVMGATVGSVGALVRARWSYVITRSGHPPEGRLHTAYSLESVLDEVVFIVGPLLVTLLATRVSPVAGLMAAGVAVAVGGAALFAQRASEPPPSGGRPVAGTDVLRSSGMLSLMVAFAFMGAMFGAIEVVTVAFTAKKHQTEWAGLVLAAYAVSSMTAGLGYGAVRWRSSTATRLLVGVLATVVLLVPTALARTVPALTVGLFAAGLAVAPTIINGTALVQDLVDQTRLTEGLTWLSTALVIGVSAGAAISGKSVDAFGIHVSLLIPLLAATGAAMATALSWPVLRRDVSTRHLLRHHRG